MAICTEIRKILTKNLIVLHFNSADIQNKIVNLYVRLGSLGPSTVTLIACEYVAYCNGSVRMVMVTVSILPVGRKQLSLIITY